MAVAIPACSLLCQKNTTSTEAKGFTILSWNLENLFDIYDDTLTVDEEFTPDGLRNWNNYRYYLKIRAVWKTILSVDEERPPAIIAVCEIENEKVLRDLFTNSPFGRFGYQIVHHDSPDPRGIDVALLYDPTFFELTDTSWYQPVTNLSEPHPSRDILYAVLRNGKDSLHIFVNHWPSKYGGAGYTEPLRKAAAATLHRLTDSVCAKHENAYILCMGDFNDTPESASIHSMSVDGPARTLDSGSGLVRLKMSHEKVDGTIRYQGQWQTIDHFFISGNFYSLASPFRVDSASAEIYAPDFLLEPDESYGGFKPFRTYTGMRYNGGVSDHLPVILRMRFREEAVE